MATEDSFVTLAGPGEAETRVIGSRFLAVALPVADEEEARTLLEARRQRFFDATHNCSAWRLRDGTWRANDAGEPGGSAGAPILAAIDGAGVRDCLVVVTRFFGGTKLGVGGLVRAYGEIAALALEAAPRLHALRAVRVRVRYPYPHTSAVMRVLERVGAEEVEHGFFQGGQLGEISATLPRGAEGDLGDQLREQTAGAVEAERVGERLLYRAAPEQSRSSLDERSGGT